MKYKNSEKYQTPDLMKKIMGPNPIKLEEELAEKIFVTRQAVSRWETGETIPNIDTLKLLSKLFDVSINTLLGSPRELICGCCLYISKLEPPYLLFAVFMV